MMNFTTEKGKSFGPYGNTYGGSIQLIDDLHLHGIECQVAPTLVKEYCIKISRKVHCMTLGKKCGH